MFVSHRQIRVKRSILASVFAPRGGASIATSLDNFEQSLVSRSAGSPIEVGLGP